mgnify:CR=1 FL=1
MGTPKCERGSKADDLVASRVGWLLWGIPAVLLTVGSVWAVSRAWLWIPAFAVAGAACLANAARCGRLHCFLTGPLFLLGALATLLDGLGVVAIDWRSSRSLRLCASKPILKAASKSTVKITYAVALFQVNRRS